MEIAKEHMIPNYTTSPETIFEDREIDLVSIATSSSRHFGLALRALESHKHVLCEKPLSSSVSEAKSLCDSAIKSKVKTKVNFGFRYSKAITKMKKMVGTGFLGRTFLLNGFEQNSKYLVGNSVLRSTARRGSSTSILPGSLKEYAPHIIDLALWMIGDFKSVVGYMENFVQRKNQLAPADDGAIWLAEFANGSIGTMQSSFVAIGPAPGIELRIYGSKGALTAKIPGDDGKSESLRSATPDSPKMTSVNILRDLRTSSRARRGISPTPSQERFQLLLEDFVQDIQLDRQNPQCSFEEGLRVQKVVDAIHRSFTERRWVNLGQE